MLEARDVHKSYFRGDQEIKILKGLSLKVEAGEKIAILGKSGSGKSTLLSLLSGLDSVDQGEIIVENNSLNTLNEDQLARLRAKHIGIIFQQYHLLAHLKAWENVALPLEILEYDDIDARVQNALSQVGLSHRMDHFPQELSGGECQRVAMARAIIALPSFVLADEPSGSLDETTGNSVIENLFNLIEQNKTTLILVTHNKELAQKCDRLLELKDGQLLEVTD